MPTHPQLQRFVDDELMRAPLLFDEAFQGTLDAMRKDMALQERSFTQALQAQQSELSRRFVASLRQQVSDELDQPARERAAPKLSSLSLVDDDAVLADVELSRAIEVIDSIAEHELRELRTYTSALVGDVHVARNTNPFRPDVHARALWAAALALPVTRGQQIAFMRHAAPALGKALRKAYAAACTRLEDAGVEPGTYSTIVLPAGTRTPRPSEKEPPPLAEVRDSMPVPLDEPAPNAPPMQEVLIREDEMLRLRSDETGGAARTIDSQRTQLLASASTRADQQVIELLSRLFDAILTDRSTAPQVLVLLSRLHTSALRCALREPATLEGYDHPLWQFVDRIAFIAEVYPDDADALRAKMLEYVRGVIDHMVREPVQDANLFRWGLSRLMAFEQHVFERRCQLVVAQIQSLEAMAGEAPGDEHAALDVGSLATVPANLLDLELDAAAAPRSEASQLDALRPTQWVHVFHEGEWRIAQLLWRDEPGALWLFAGTAYGKTWALKRAALDRLHGAKLFETLQPRSLVRRAAELVLREFQPPG